MFNNSILPNPEVSGGNDCEKGFTIVELLISMVVFLIITGSIYGLLRISQQGRLTVNQQVQLTKNVRTALNLVGRDALNAGFGYPLKDSVSLRDKRISTLLGIPVDTNSAADTIPPVIVGNNVTTNTFATPNTNTDQVSFLYKDSTFNIVGSAGPPDKRTSEALNITSITNSGGTVQVKVTGNNSSCRANDIYVVTGNSGSSALGVATVIGTGTDNDKINFANADVLGFNQPYSTAILRTLTAPATMQRVKLVTYMVTPDGTLIRRDFANSISATTAQNYVDEPLVYGVEDFQIQYILADGTVSDNPSAGPDGIAGNDDDVQSRLSTVRQIRFTVKAKSTELSATGEPYRVSMTSTFAARNLGYDPN